MSKFINPFHFVPLTKAIHTSDVEQVRRSFEKNDGDVKHLSHAQYPENTLSGTIVCKLTTKSPCVFGNRHRSIPIDASEVAKQARGEKHDCTTIVENLSLGGKAAIAASSIKGMLSTLMEMASGSSMRVLENRVLSQRSQMFGSRSAIGMIVGEKGQRKLVPLSLPTFSSRDRNPYKPTDKITTNQLWHKLITDRRKFDSDCWLTSAYVELTEPCFQPASKVQALKRNKPTPQILWNAAIKGPAEFDNQHRDCRKGELLRPAETRELNKLPKVQEFNRNEPGLIPGLVRTLGLRQGSAGTRNQKWPEFGQFLYIPKDWIDEQGQLAFANIPETLLLDAENACHEFDRIVTDHASSAPPKSSSTNLPGQEKFSLPKKKGDKCGNTGLKQGDLVCFRPRWVDERTQAIDVESVSISSIWRDGPRVLWDAEKPQVDLLDSWERVPMQPGRETVTMAEKLLGWVDQPEIKIEEQEKDRGKLLDVMSAYKGRIRVSDARSNHLLSDCQEINTTKEDWSGLNPDLSGYFPLQILGSPRPPCAEFYLHRNGDNAYRDFATSDKLKIQGWKFYWRHGDASIFKAKTKVREKKSWKQKCWVKPIRPGVDFTFSIHFDNLTKSESELLCYALCPNANEHDESRQFLHSIGFAKPLGFGAVRIDIERVRLVDRAQRYGSEKDLLKTTSIQTVEKADQEKDNKVTDVLKRSRNHAKLIGELHQVICLMGRPIVGNTPIIYPTCSDQELEGELFEWFRANRHKDGENLNLRPLKGDETDDRLSLERHQKIQ